MPQTIRLTPQQQAIVDHNEGPALVYAVAGAGKTTAMVHRIARLVHEEVFPARQILATSFNKDANRQIEAALQQWPACAEVTVRTLHALGYTVIRTAAARGYLPGFDPNRAGHNVSRAERTILMLMLERLRARQDRLVSDLGTLDHDDFLAYVRHAKAALAFAHTPAGLTWGARRTLQKPARPADRPWYPDLYRAFEETRTEAGLLTFDDMLATGWLLLARHHDLLELMQRRYRCVLVDEFQDVNRAQAEILDLLTRPGRNYMVIGDDDQTIYEWRGANPFFIRNFKKRYRATRVYFMTDNFRSRASQLALANRVIQHDRARQAKYLQLTRGFGGTTELRTVESDEAAAAEIARTALLRREAGIEYDGMVVLVRIYAQTVPVEAALRRAGIPFTVINEAEPMHKRVTGITITSVFRAKGLEWPVVFLPDCNDGIVPYRQSGNVDEERRLFYVALTRAREELYLFVRRDRPLSPFLAAADAAAVLQAAAQVGDALSRPPAQWGPEEYLAVAVNAKRLYLHEFLLHWWTASPAQRQQVAQAVMRYYATLRRYGKFRVLGLTRADQALWREIGGGRIREEPLDRAVLAPLE